MRHIWKLIRHCARAGAAGLLLLAAPGVTANRNVSPTVLPNGWKITPAGRIVALAGDMPLRVLPLRDGRKALVLTGGFHNHSLSIVDIAGGRIQQTLELGKDWAGLPADPTGSNDVALGRLVEAISHSRFWAETAIFVIEDDAQNGPDHVDCRRTVGLVISPFTKQGIVNSTHYTTASMVHTMELILGLPTMTQYDRAATPLYGSFQSHANLWAFEARTPQTDLQARNPATGPGAVASAKLDFSDYDRADPDTLNKILWDALRPGEAMPAPVHSAAFLQGR